METQIKNYEQNRDSISKYLKNLDSKCKKHFGPNNKYKIPKNPYQYNSLDDFKKFEIGNISEPTYIKTKNVCEFIGTKEPDKIIDKDKRYYKNINNEIECKQIDGAWDPNSLNRQNKYDSGVCWTDNVNKQCAASYDQSLLKPYQTKFKDISNKIVEQADKCNKTDMCNWKQMTAYTYDCIKDNSDNTDTTTKQQKEMPLDNKLETYLDDWYSGKFDNKPPETAELIGTGNRCIKQPEELTKPPEKPKYIDYIDYRLYNPNKAADAAILLEAMNNDIKKFKVIKEEYNTKNKITKNVSQRFYNLMDKKQFEEDHSLTTSTIAKSKKQFLPSIPQSVVNTIMKRVAETQDDKRGILAWHSVGSGKCHALNTPILMYDGSIKLVQDIKIGDKLMGDDSTPRNVLELGTGMDNLYDIVDQYNNKYTVNSEHILCLINPIGKIINIEVNNFLKLSIQYQKLYKGYRVPVNFQSQLISEDPYQIGYNITTNIPDNYKINSREIRLYVLAGIIDRYGKLNNSKDNIIITNIDFKDELLFLARSLGFTAFMSNNTIIIIGILSNIPTQILTSFKNTANTLSSTISVLLNNTDQYYGFTLDGNHKYLLGDFTVTHNTCTAAGIMDAFWDTDRPIIFASSIDAIASNPDYKFHECLYNLFPRFSEGEFKGRNQAESLALIAAAFKKRNIKFLSFAKLSNRVVKAIEYKKINKIGGAKVKKELSHADILKSEGYVDLENAVLIIDEVHNLYRPLPNQQKEHALLEAELLDPKKHPNLKIIILTATPGNNMPDMIKLLNMVRNVKDPIIKAPNIESSDELQIFKQQIRGLISYFDMSNDTTKFPNVKDTQEFIKTPMGQKQFEKYVEAYKSVKADQKNFNKLEKTNQINKYWEPARKYANMLFNFEKDMNLTDYSAKIPYLLENIAKYPTHKQYVYSAFYTKMGYGGQGIIAIAKELEKNGYKKLTIAQAKKLNKSKKLPEVGVKRYILAISTELGEEKGSAGDNLSELLKIYNHPENKNGELIHLMLASQNYNEGLDLKCVQDIHVFEPFISMSGDIQIIGRACRFCSHSDLPYNQWNITIHRYMSEKPITVTIDNEPRKQQLQEDINNLEDKLEEYKIAKNKIELANIKLQIKEKQKELKILNKPPKFKADDIENIEEKIFKESRDRFKEILTMYQCMKEAAVDCKIMNKFHSHTGVDIKCFDP